MKNILALALFSLVIFSCKKEKAKTQHPVADDTTYSHVTTTGSYWVYNWYQVDSTGEETLITTLKDTIRIVGDTTINGKIYQKYTGKEMGINVHYYQRDSSGYIVNPNGSIAYTYTGGPALLNAFSDGTIKQWSYIGEKDTINTVFGSKAASTTYLEFSRENGNPINSCGDLSVRFYRHYASGLGCIQLETEYLTQMQSLCSKKRAKLSAFYIAP